MGFAKCYAAQTVGLAAHIVCAEADLTKGTHAFSIVGLPDKSVEESKDRISAAVKNSSFKSPKQGQQKLILSLTPANFKKEGTLFDLASALAYLAAAGEIKFDSSKKLFLGELALDGKLRPVRGTLPLVRKAKEAGFLEVYLPIQNAEEAAYVDGIDIFGCDSLREVVENINELLPKEERAAMKKTPKTVSSRPKTTRKREYGFEDIRGQETAKRALEIAAAGRHNVLMYGPPGTGKTMLARAFSQILPEISFDEALEITGIHSITGTLREAILSEPPFRAPHHTSSYVSIIGGGAVPKPGEITLAHRGVLFLDEFPEFEKRVLESLREPLEEKFVSISRAKGTEIFPANFILIAAMNPCPCGHRGTKKECICSAGDIYKYERKLSGPIVDRIDIFVNVAEIDYKKLSDVQEEGVKTSDDLKRSVESARTVQKRRFAKHSREISANSEMNAKELDEFAALGEREKGMLNAAANRMTLSPRAYHRIIKLARTIADLDGSDKIEAKHLAEALSYRQRGK